MLKALFMILIAISAPRAMAGESATEAAIRKSLAARFDLAEFSDVRIHFASHFTETPEHAVVSLVSKNFHRLELVKVDLDRSGNPVSITRDYHLQPGDQAPLAKPRCPDDSVEFIAFAPVDNALEQKITNDVADYAEAHGLRTVRLLKKAATGQRYLDYMSCPNLKGNFYDGDSNPQEFLTADGVITANDMRTILGGSFRFKVTNIWLACQAFNEPMLPALIDSDQSQKYAAGVNDLVVGPSDNTAACAMKAAIDGKPMQAAFEECYYKFDTRADHWGFDGKGSDLFGR